MSALFSSILIPGFFLLACILQLHYFHRPFMRITDPEHAPAPAPCTHLAPRYTRGCCWGGLLQLHQGAGWLHPPGLGLSSWEGVGVRSHSRVGGLPLCILGGAGGAEARRGGSWGDPC